MKLRFRWLAGFPFLMLTMQCATAPTRFPAKAPMQVDTEDFRLLEKPPDEYRAATIWDAVDETLLRPVPELFTIRGKKPAINVNSVDEVPNSSWFTNRKPQEWAPERVAKGACDKPLDPEGPFEILSGKPDGWNPGFLVKAKDGRKYFFKFDQHQLQPERMSMAEVVGSLIYSAVGFTVPCYEIIYFNRQALFRSKKATVKDKTGKKVPMTEATIDEAFRLAKFTEDGKVRAVSSLLLEGKPTGPWTYAGTTSDDPNDVVPHEHRREVRAGYVLASWISHFDTRDQNTLSTWIADKEDGPGYVRHNILDFGDSLGNLSDEDAVSRRLGYSYYLDLPYFIEDFLTLGLVERPWDKIKYGPGGPVLGYYDVENFDPENWHSGYPNPAFNLVTEADGAWMARIIAEFRDEHLNAIVEKARLQDATVKKQLLDTIKGRRDKLLRRWFSKLSTLTSPEVTATSPDVEVCLRDMALYAKLYDPARRSYQFRLGESEPGIPLAAQTKDSRVCFSIPSARETKDKYLVVEIRATSPENPHEQPARLHLADVEGRWTVVGLERL